MSQSRALKKVQPVSVSAVEAGGAKLFDVSTKTASKSTISRLQLVSYTEYFEDISDDNVSSWLTNMMWC